MFLILLALKSLLIAGGTLAVLRLMRNRSAADRGTIAHMGLLALVLLPLASLSLPSLPVPSSWASGALIPGDAEGPTLTTATVLLKDYPVTAFPTTLVAVALYLGPALALLFSTILALFRLAGLRARAEVLVNAYWLDALARAQRRMNAKSGTALLVSDDLDSPVSWGLMRPTILLNEAAVRVPDQAEAVIAHELAHVLHFDWLKLIISRLAIAIFWFNPFAWVLAREAHQLREELADDAVLNAEVAGPDYAELQADGRLPPDRRAPQFLAPSDRARARRR